MFFICFNRTHKVSFMLQTRHRRDQNIQFLEEPHIYIVNRDPSIKYISVTTLIKSLFPQFDTDIAIKNMRNGKKWNETHECYLLSDAEIKEKWSTKRDHASALGTQMHKNIEFYFNHLYNSPDKAKDYFDQSSQEWNNFLQFLEDLDKTKIPYRTEWCIYHEDLQLAGSIDMVFLNEDGTVSLYDWKRSKEFKKTSQMYGLDPIIQHIPDANFWHYSMQLNLYKKMLEEKYDLKVRDMYIVGLHPNHPTYQLFEAPNMSAVLTELLHTYI